MTENIDIQAATGGTSYEPEQTQTIGRNDQCLCGSGKKYKKCCLAEEERKEAEKIEQDNFMAQVTGQIPMEQDTAIKLCKSHTASWLENHQNDIEYLESIVRALRKLPESDDRNEIIADFELALDELHGENARPDYKIAYKFVELMKGYDVQGEEEDLPLQEPDAPIIPEAVEAD